MRVADVREFRNRTPELVTSGEVIFVTRRGKLSGVLVPLQSPQDIPAELRRQISGRIGATIAEDLRSRGVNEEEVQGDFEAWRATRRPRRPRRRGR